MPKNKNPIPPKPLRKTFAFWKYTFLILTALIGLSGAWWAWKKQGSTPPPPPENSNEEKQPELEPEAEPINEENDNASQPEPLLSEANLIDQEFHRIITSIYEGKMIVELPVQEHRFEQVGTMKFQLCSVLGCSFNAPNKKYCLRHTCATPHCAELVVNYADRLTKYCPQHL